MKKGNLQSVLFVLLIFAGIIFISATAVYDRSPGMDNAISKVYKSELQAGTTNEEVANLLVQKMMAKYSIGTRGWTQWVWSYKINEIRLNDSEGFDEGIGVVLYVKPLISDYWANIWTFEVDRVDGGWVRVGYFMVIDDRGDYYELRGPFTGG
jgi:hypothetical protein